jgi:hypothetical protein
MWKMIHACEIMHNMIIESERANPTNDNHLYDFPTKFGAFLAMQHEICDENVQQQLQDDLMNDLWARRRNTV